MYITAVELKLTRFNYYFITLEKSLVWSFYIGAADNLVSYRRIYQLIKTL